MNFLTAPHAGRSATLSDSEESAGGGCLHELYAEEEWPASSAKFVSQTFLVEASRRASRIDLPALGR